MDTGTQFSCRYTEVLHRIVDIVTDYAYNDRPSPTIKQLSVKTGYSEEVILESMEYGNYNDWMFLH
ncbi:hypothetical protein [Salisediminibacterium halotolerans]|uniref:hypothetical protein n=1 Tax=Salisediminibacterium halotolerans TaxID=517425 RepID=UPI000EAEC538|nr:hypothetical protein [Salisediminibacterium halotolerans]RLJ78047.1 hypothetical protein BCL39_0511 [Actinophytocola xinjiangensis]RPE88615.1 hypothetical protein EDD67_0948 [Salisediminibacterium halotolerans]TWG37024.1 hypothetical protein BCL52_0510 [Salisediminibacterium halotolerans]GEL08289.1 hypothetical protein SHA02_17050 [Salisediminibacterium halotolerans]